jgi:HAMP domain-containing protein
MAQMRRTLLANRKFQLRFSLYVCSWIVALSLVYPLIIYNLFEFFAHYETVDPAGPTYTALAATRTELLRLLIILHSLFLAITFLISLFVSHRIAGPLYKLSKAFTDGAAGSPNANLSFRRTDHFQELAHGYNEMVSSFRAGLDRHTSSSRAAVERLGRALSHHPSPEVVREIEEALVALREIEAPLPAPAVPGEPAADGSGGPSSDNPAQSG